MKITEILFIALSAGGSVYFVVLYFWLSNHHMSRDFKDVIALCGSLYWLAAMLAPSTRKSYLKILQQHRSLRATLWIVFILMVFLLLFRGVAQLG